MRIELWMRDTVQPKVFYVDNAWVTGGMYCFQSGDYVYKYPLTSLFRVVEPRKADAEMDDTDGNSVYVGSISMPKGASVPAPPKRRAPKMKEVDND